MNRFLAAALVSMPFALAVAAGCSPSNDTTTPIDKKVTNPDDLDPPLQGQGFQFKTQLFPVNAGDEIQNCYFYRIGDLAKQAGMSETDPINLHKIRIVQKSGSHHMNLFRVRTIVGLDPAKGVVQEGKNGVGECFKSPNWADWPLVANTQQAGDLDWEFPDGVANVFQPDEWIMLQTHYVNASSQKSPDGGEVAINFHTITKDKVTAELGTLFATKQSIRVCKSNPTPLFTGNCGFNNKVPVNIIGANGHFHSRGKQFSIFTSDGTTVGLPPDDQKFYESRVWDEPPMLRSPDLNKVVPPGGGVAYSCSFEWTPPLDTAGGCKALDDYDVAKHADAKPDCCYTFGPIVERNEHCNAFVYYYPKQDDVNCN